VIGIGGSALGPQLVNHALGQPRKDKLAVSFFDNTDPDGIDYVLAGLRGQLAETLRRRHLEIRRHRRNAQRPARSRRGVQSRRPRLHETLRRRHGRRLQARSNRARPKVARPFPHVGLGRRPHVRISAVGLLPAALQGLDIEAMLDGAAAMDVVTRNTTIGQNPAALLALMWHFATDGRGAKDMVVLPYKDRLLLFSRYLQQLVMESLGKEHDLKGNVVNQGIAVYGNKGSTDQHAYVQQLRDGVNNFFVTFIEVLEDRDAKAYLEVEPGTTAGDFLQGFYLGTRDALGEKTAPQSRSRCPTLSPAPSAC